MLNFYLHFRRYYLNLSRNAANSSPRPHSRGRPKEQKMSIRQVTRIAVVTAALALATVPAFAWSTGGGGCTSNCGGTAVPEPSTLALLGIAVPGAAAWIKR